MTLGDQYLCEQWISSYMRPVNYINHMHGEVGLRLMMQDDTHVKVSKEDFRKLMLNAGHLPANEGAAEWEFRISSQPLRLRPKSKADGWTAAKWDTPKRRA